MYKLLLPLILILLSYPVIAQQKTAKTVWHLTIVDNNTNKGIDKATIVVNKKKFYDTNNAGTTDIDKSIINSRDSVLISCIGYQSKSFLIRSNEYSDTIRLSISAITLKEVKISLDNEMPTILGDVKKIYKVHRRTNPDGAYAQFIPNDKKTRGTITLVEYVINDISNGISMPFRVRLYTKMKDSITLDKELTSDSIIVYNPEKKNRIIVDVSRYNIQFPEDGVIVIFETLPRSYYTKDTASYSTINNDINDVKTPGIDMDQTKNKWQLDYNKTNRTTPYAMVGPTSDRWNWNDSMDQWYVYQDGNNFAITITIALN